MASRRLNAQLAVEPAVIAELLEQAGWEYVPESDWRWVIQALNPEPDEATLPLLGRAFEGRSEVLLLRKSLGLPGRLLTIRMWDSGVRLMPGSGVYTSVRFRKKCSGNASACSATGVPRLRTRNTCVPSWTP